MRAWALAHNISVLIEKIRKQSAKKQKSTRDLLMHIQQKFVGQLHLNFSQIWLTRQSLMET
uniref:Uncharacterized protein n=1 Tax=Rhizophora mucronata TaxID=61149 RepID=A0A2P2JTZ6_RHIMU